MTKVCKICLVEKPLSDYYKHPRMSLGCLNICKECKKNYEKESENHKKYDKTEKGIVRVIYKTQRSNSKKRGHIMPSYTKDELCVWLYLNGFKVLFDKWVASGYAKTKKPSIDRDDDYLPYSFDNIRLVTWEDNHKKAIEDVLLGRSTSGEKCKSVIQLSKDGAIIKEFASQSIAGRELGIPNKNISSVCRGVRKTAGGFVFKHKEG